MSYTIHELANLAGVSVRTLHYYDEIELLKPSALQKNGYRIYDQAALLRLQQILFFRELEFPLDEIKKILASPNYHQIAALKEQKHLLSLKQKRLEGLIKTIIKTINHMNKKTALTDEEIYGSFNTKDLDQYAAEAKARWGQTDAWKQSQARIKNWSKADYDRIKNESETLAKAIAALMPKGVEHAEVQTLIKKHHAGIEVFYSCSLEMYKNLGQMYVDDPRFSAHYEKYAPGLALFMRDAITIFCQTKE